MDTHIYNVNIRWSEDRKGMMCSPELKEPSVLSQNCIEVATPPQFDKGMDGIWSPEHLFTASVSSCLMTTFLAVAEYSKLDFTDFHCAAQGKLEKVNGKFEMTEIKLFPEVTVKDQAHEAKALKVLEKSEKACLVSNSIKSEVTMESTVHIAEMAE